VRNEHRHKRSNKAFILTILLWILLGALAFWNALALGTAGNLELSLSISFMLTLAAIKMAEVLRGEVSRLF
jgi:heme/copper-type cytochrome/quinol oxidase subunit 4